MAHNFRDKFRRGKFFKNCTMACQSCAIKFTLFKRKKQCMECYRYFCSDCVIRRVDRILSCDNCSMLSRRPLIRSQVLQMRTRDLRQYLVAKKVSLQGCVEKEDLVHLLMLFANGVDEYHTYNIYTSATTNERNSTSTNQSTNSPPRRSRSPPNSFSRNQVPAGDQAVQNEPIVQEPTSPTRSATNVSSTDPSVPPTDSTLLSNDHTVHIEEIPEDTSTSSNGPEPVVTERDDGSESSNESLLISIVKLTDITEVSELENLSVKQLKYLLSGNRVDFKGCVERSELLDRASRLWLDHKNSRKEFESASEDGLCKICLDAPIECVILECGHMVCCITCGKQMSECPICRQYVVRVVRFFKS